MRCCTPPVLNGQTNRGATALMLAASRGSRRLVELLCNDPRSDINITDFGSPPKTVVDRVARSQTEIKNYLLQRGGRFAGAHHKQ